MGGLVSGIFDLFGGDPAQQQEDQLQTLGTEQTATGEGLVAPAAKYYEDILSGDPTRIASSLAPEIKTGQEQVEQQRLSNAQFGTRSGGTAASTNAAEDKNRADIIALEGGLQERAAGAAGSLGTSQESLGAGNINDVAGMKTARRKQVGEDVGGIASGVASIAAPFLEGAPAAEGDPFQTLYNAQHPDRSISTDTDTSLDNYQFS